MVHLDTCLWLIYDRVSSYHVAKIVDLLVAGIWYQKALPEFAQRGKNARTTDDDLWHWKTFQDTSIEFYSVPYKHLYKVPLAVQTIQRHPSVIDPPGRRKDLRRWAEEEEEPDIIWAWVYEGRLFHIRGPV